jgi:Uma2 family endonuclease
MAYALAMGTARHPATYADLLALPDDVRAEVLNGELVTSPSATPRHSRAQRSLSRLIGGPYDDDDGRGGPGGWWILLEVDIELHTHDIVRPDIAGWRRPRLPDPWDQRPLRVPPDWVCEIVSPYNAARDRVTKRRLYAEHGVAYYWLVDPVELTLEALKLHDGQWLELGSWDHSACARIEPFLDVELELACLFPPNAAQSAPKP